MNQSRVRIKMCGMTSVQDIEHAVACGVDAIGLIFYSESRRNITIDHAKLLLRTIPLFVDVVAVMVNPQVAYVEKIINELSVQWLQFHGDESPEFCAQFKKPYIKSVAVSRTTIIDETMRLHPKASAILLDTPSLMQRGGTGKVFNWSMIPSERTKPIILAGGLNASNVKVAVVATSPYAVDVCSGVEKSPGIKDHEQMIKFVNALRGGLHE